MYRGKSIKKEGVILNITERIASSEKLLKDTIGIDEAWILLGLLEGQSVFPHDVLQEFRLYSEYLPRIDDFPYTEEQRLLHLIWEIFDRLPLSIVANFAIPFRRILAKKIFKKCGKNFSCEEGVRFNFPQNIEIGDDVLIAPNNSYVNVNVPSHSIVIGNPATIHHRDNATEGYVNFRV